MLLYWHSALRRCLRTPPGRNRVCSATGSAQLTLHAAQVLLVVIIVSPGGSPNGKGSKP